MEARVCGDCGCSQTGRFCTRCGNPLFEAALPDIDTQAIPEEHSSSDEETISEPVVDELASPLAGTIPFWSMPTAAYMILFMLFFLYTIIQIWY
ncbi:MAG: hypothetical protein K0R57_4694 [Paenibacillaceae bacterium]|jgi:hypothetical protein|nr:hypothetical protein [Paenibacillaceae bacterium]